MLASKHLAIACEWNTKLDNQMIFEVKLIKFLFWGLLKKNWNKKIWKTKNHFTIFNKNSLYLSYSGKKMN